MSQTINPDLLHDALPFIDRWVARQQERRDTPGIVVAIRHHDQLLLEKGYGLADLQRQIPMTPRHIFRIASHSKTFTATAIMQLVEAGKLRLDDRLIATIPWLPASLAEVTIRQALNHSSGIVRDGNDCDYWLLAREFPDTDELRRLVEDGGMVIPANEQFKYSNIAYSLLGLVIEAAAGMPYNNYVTQNIVDRLGLRDTGPDSAPPMRERLVTGYTVRRFGVPRRALRDVPTHAMSAATGFYATAADLSSYAMAHCSGNAVLLSDASKREMQQPYWTVEQADQHYGLGFNYLQIAERRFVGHGGGFPGHTTYTMVDPKNHLAIVVLTNESGGPAGALAQAMARIIDYALAQPPRSAGEPSHAYERFTGCFANIWGGMQVVALGDTLVALDPDADDPVKGATTLVVEDADTLRITATGGYGAPQETVRYQRDASGTVIRVIDAGNSLYPLDVFREMEMAH